MGRLIIAWSAGGPMLMQLDGQGVAASVVLSSAFITLARRVPTCWSMVPATIAALSPIVVRFTICA